MTMPFDAQTEFAQRIERIRAGGQGTNRTLYVGMDSAMAIPSDFRPAGKAGSRRRNRAAGWVLTVAIVGAASFGAAAYAATQGVISLPDMSLPV